jgi:hypothetical protein
MTYQTYTFEETYSYEVYAETPEKALEQFHEFRETEDEFETDTKFLDNSITIYDQEGNEVQA